MRWEPTRAKEAEPVLLVARGSEQLAASASLAGGVRYPVPSTAASSARVPSTVAEYCCGTWYRVLRYLVPSASLAGGVRVRLQYLG